MASLPDPPGYYPTLDGMYLVAPSGPQFVQWLGTYWEGPIGGAAFVLDCNGNKLALRQFGGVMDLHPGPRLPIGETTEIEYVAGTGTGVRVHAVALATYKEGAIKVLWDHVIYEMAGAPGSEYEDQYRWTMSADKKTISVTGQRKVGSIPDEEHHWAPMTIHALQSELHCWNEKTQTFEACH